MQSDDIKADLGNRDLAFVYALTDRVKNDLILTLAGLAEKKVARATFYFLAQKLNTLHNEDDTYRRLIERHQLKKKRDREIAHREQPEDWPKAGDVRISYAALTRAVASAVRIMKKFDAHVMGERAYVQWHRVRAKRYDLTMPARAKYLLVGLFA